MVQVTMKVHPEPGRSTVQGHFRSWSLTVTYCKGGLSIRSHSLPTWFSQA